MRISKVWPPADQYLKEYKFVSILAYPSLFSKY